MDDVMPTQSTHDYWGRKNLGQAILDALVASGTNLEALTIDDLAPMDHYHGGGMAATMRLAQRAGLTPETRVLDVGGGLGGPARTLAVTFGCQVTVIDLTESYVQAAQLLTAKLGLDDRVTHHTGNALELPFDDGSFDVVWTQNSGMNISAKAELYTGFCRVLRPGGVLAFQEPMAGPVQPLMYPVMWARDATTSFLRIPEEMREIIEAAGFRVRTWQDVMAEISQSGGARPAHSIQRLVMGDTLDAITRAGNRNREEGRMVMVHAICDRP